MKILVSACLLGTPCRYDGRAKANAAVLALGTEHELIPVCPEVLGGLPTPRPPAERRPGGRIVDRTGRDVTAEYEAGAAARRLLDAGIAVLNEDETESYFHSLKERER